MYSLQDMIFEKKLSRIDLLNYKPSSRNSYKIAVYRNHSFELVEHTIGIYLDYADISADFKYSNYDDSMSFFDLDLNSDMLILWIDFTRYSIPDVEVFVKERIKYLTSIYKKRILLIPYGIDLKIEQTNVVIYDLSGIESRLQEDFTDIRLETFSGTKLSSKAQMLISKELGTKYIPACLMTPLKAVIIDLDNTLYSGVLGEDGYKNIVLTKGYKKLQEKLVELSNQGFFICVASKNEEKDVVEMFNKRADFPLKLNNITKLCASWDKKSSSINEIRKFLNISTSDMLFIDDNMGEIVEVKNTHPDINIIIAKENPLITLDVIDNFPRMLKLNINYEDSIRKQDTKHNKKREELKNTLSQDEYLKTLQMEIKYGINIQSETKRIAELANKTNQFIFSYKRYTEKEIEDLLKNDKYRIVTVSLKDKLSDSGIIGVLVFKNKKEYINIEEVFISCRALSRGIDDSIILYPIQLMTEEFNKDTIKVDFKKGERNLPAEKYINEKLNKFKNKIDEFNKTVNNKFIKICIERGY